jgi:hypothetical protein
MKRWQQLLLTAFSLLAVGAAFVIAVSVLIPGGSRDRDERPFANLTRQDLDRLVIIEQGLPRELAIADQTRQHLATLTADAMLNPDGTPRGLPVLVSRREPEGATRLSQDEDTSSSQPGWEL